MIGNGISKLMVTTERKAAQVTQRPGRCRNCNERGHWARDCRKPKGHEVNVGSSNTVRISNDDKGLIFNAATFKDKNTWYFDGGASYSITWDRSAFKSYTKVDKNIEIADGSQLKVCGIGNIEIAVNSNGRRSIVVLQHVRHVPQANCQLLSEILLVEEGCSISKYDNKLQLHKGGELYLGVEIY